MNDESNCRGVSFFGRQLCMLIIRLRYERLPEYTAPFTKSQTQFHRNDIRRPQTLGYRSPSRPQIRCRALSTPTRFWLQKFSPLVDLVPVVVDTVHPFSCSKPSIVRVVSRGTSQQGIYLPKNSLSKIRLPSILKCEYHELIYFFFFFSSFNNDFAAPVFRLLRSTRDSSPLGNAELISVSG